MATIILGILSTSSVNGFIDNLTEMDLNERDISLLMEDKQTARNIIDDNGPLKGVTVDNLPTAFQRLKLGNVNTYLDLIKQGNALVAVSVKNSLTDTIKETFNDYNAQQITVI